MAGLGTDVVLSETGVRVGGTLYTSQSLSSGMAAAAGPAGGAEKMAAPHAAPAAAGGRRGQRVPLCACAALRVRRRPRCMLGAVVRGQNGLRPRPGGQQSPASVASIASVRSLVKVVEPFSPGPMEGFSVWVHAEQPAAASSGCPERALAALGVWCPIRKQS